MRARSFHMLWPDHEQQSGTGIGGCLPRKRGIKASITKLARDAGLCTRCMPALLELMKSSFPLPTQVMIAEAFFAGLVGISLLLFGCRRHEQGQQQSEYRIGEFNGPTLSIARSATTNGCRIAWAAEKGHAKAKAARPQRARFMPDRIARLT